MAAAFYDKARDSFGQAQINLLTDNLKVILVSAAYTVNLTTDQFLSDIPGAAILATSPNLAGKTLSGGIFDATDTTWTAVPGPTQGVAVVMYQDTGVAATSRLIFYDSAYTNLPVTPNGGNIDVTWDNGANKIFKI